MLNATTFKVLEIRNDIAHMQKVGGGFMAFAEGTKYLGKPGEIVEVLEIDYTPEGDLAGYQQMLEKFNA